MKFLSMISEIHFFNSTLAGKTFLLKNSKKTVEVIFKKYAPLKDRYARAYRAPFINKTVTKEIMKRSRVRNNFLK